ncbi:MAG: Spy/CpxP family protein refolding chaperone [Acetobacteraceae bacterium]|nr:Spy/CpxP family protein refolding chaperone [Acetobacteraceae bacterium]
MAPRTWTWLLAAPLALSAGGAGAHHGEAGPHPPAQTVQHRHHQHVPAARGGDGARPYAGMEAREIKALSAEEVADLRAGRGMGLALPAELNRYPGPMHVLELADPLRLSPEQRRRMEALVEAVRAEVRPLGERVIAAEGALDRLFATAQATPAAVTEASAAVGAARGSLRAAHLRYHLAARESLTPEQLARYEELRGYAAARR